MRVALATTLSLLLVGSASAHGYRHHSFNCGRVQMAYFGLHDPCLALASCWLRYSRTTPHAGAVVFNWRKGHALGGGPGGHVSHIVQVMNQCEAIVSDDRGTYARNICRGATIVQPN